MISFVRTILRNSYGCRSVQTFLTSRSSLGATFLWIMLFLFCVTAISSAEDLNSPDLLDEALDAIAATKKDLGIRKDLNANERMVRFDRWIASPLMAPGETREDVHRLFQAAPDPVLWLMALGVLGEIKDASPLPTEHTFQVGMMHRLPGDLLSCVEPLLAAMAAANGKLEQTFMGMAGKPYRRLMTSLLGSTLSGLEGDEREDWASGRELDELINYADRVDRKVVLEAGLTVLAAMHEVKIRLSAYMEKGHSIETQVLKTTLGRVEIGGPGPDEHHTDAAVVIDVGGNDLYRGATAVGRNSACSVVIDLAGDDIYLGENGAQGCGIRGIGILWDVAGNDFYRAEDFAQGAGIFGLGLLVDEGGRDRYSGGVFVQAAAAWGFGGLLDMEGEDFYECRNSGQAFAGVRGMAVLCDLFGNDKYLSGATAPDHRDPSMNQSFAQGFAVGMRNMVGGGYALLADQWGNDLYECQYFGQGAGYYMGLGILYDQDGNDTYAARRYAQGAGIHYAFGMLMDGGGDDRFLSWGVSQGCGHDYGIGFLIDEDGNDAYAADWLSMGASNANGTGIFVDNAGDDRYGAQSDMPVGKVSKGRRSGGIGLFVDAGGKDVYSRGGADDTVWGKNRFAVGIDVNEGRNSGIRMVKTDGARPINPEVERQRKEEAHRLSLRLKSSESLSCPEDMVRFLSVASHRGFEKEIPDQAEKRLFHMDPNKSIPLMIEILDIPDVSSLVLLKSFFLQNAFYALPALMGKWKGSNSLVESRRCYFLGVLKDTRALPVCLDRIEDPSWKVRSVSVRAIGDMLDHQRLEILTPMKKAFEAALEEGSPKRIDAYLEEDEKGCAMALSVVVRALPLSSGLFRRFTGQCKGEQKERKNQSFSVFVYDHLLQILPIMDIWIGDIQGSHKIAERLMPLLCDPDAEVRRAAAYSLGQMQYQPAVSPLLDLFYDPNLWVRDGAVLSLTLFKDSAVGPLCERMKQEGRTFRILGLDVLSQINTEQAEKCIQGWIHVPDEKVKRAAETVFSR